MHPLTEIAFSVYDEDILDLKIKIWLTDKARDFCGFLPYEKIKEILELPEVVGPPQAEQIGDGNEI